MPTPTDHSRLRMEPREPQRVLIVRLGALGDIIHALPVAAALRDTFPSVRIDWLVSERHRAILGLVPVVDGRVVLARGRNTSTAVLGRANAQGAVDVKPSPLPLAQAVTALRAARYDVAFDLQGLIKSAVLARASGAGRVVGFAAPHLRERWAHLFYTETIEPPSGVHVVDKNLSLLAAVGLQEPGKRFPLDLPPVDAPAEPFALINPGAGWPNKRWPPERFGAVASTLRTRHGLRSLVLWGPGEEVLSRTVVEASNGAASLAPATDVAGMAALVRHASLFVSGDTGPLHIAAAVGTPVVGIYGPTNPARNGPWDAADVCVSRFAVCQCHHRRQCRLPTCCLLDIGVDEVMAAVEQRLLLAHA